MQVPKLWLGLQKDFVCFCVWGCVGSRTPCSETTLEIGLHGHLVKYRLIWGLSLPGVSVSSRPLAKPSGIRSLLRPFPDPNPESCLQTRSRGWCNFREALWPVDTSQPNAVQFATWRPVRPKRTREFWTFRENYFPHLKPVKHSAHQHSVFRFYLGFCKHMFILRSFGDTKGRPFHHKLKRDAQSGCAMVEPGVHSVHVNEHWRIQPFRRGQTRVTKVTPSRASFRILVCSWCLVLHTPDI